MVAKLLTTSIAAPGFQGLNTQDSSVTLESGFATVANNCVIDKFGRIGARKGWLPQHVSNADLGANNISSMGELITSDGTQHIVVAGNNKLFSFNGSTLSLLTYGGGGSSPTISSNNWQMAALNGCLYLYQTGHDPLVYDPAVSTTTYRRVSEKTGYVGTVQQASCVISAYGRTWSAAPSTNKSLIQFSDLLAGHVLNTGTAGTLDVATVWPDGPDEIQALAAHNGFLFIFGKRQILIYANPTDPNELRLQDAITGVGCFARDSVAVTGTDVIFLSDTGVRSLQRVIQEKSSPLRDLSANVRDDLVGEVLLESPTEIRSIYSSKEAFYLLALPQRQIVYCFDMRGTLQNGANRVTTWDGLVFKSALYTKNKDLLFGLSEYIGKYTGYLDNTNTYLLRYFTNYFDFEQPTVIKIVKKVGVTTIGGQGYPIILKFGFDFGDILNSRQFSLSGGTVAEYNIAEFANSEYGGQVYDTKLINIGGAGRVIQLGLETNVNSRSISIQKLDVYVKVGKIR